MNDSYIEEAHLKENAKLKKDCCVMWEALKKAEDTPECGLCYIKNGLHSTLCPVMKALSQVDSYPSQNE